MQGSVKASAIWIISGIMILFYIANQWMSHEISKPPARIQNVTPLSNGMPDASSRSLNIPELPQEELAVKQHVKNSRPAAAAEKSDCM
jgi:hypothetical protein